MLEQIDKKIEDSKLTEELKTERKKLKDDLAYINHFPPLKKYLSLFPPSEESHENKTLREETYSKIIKMVRVKEAIRDKELIDTDVKMADEKIAKDNLHTVEADNFFQLEDESSDGEESDKPFKF